MDFIERWNRLVALRQPILIDVAAELVPAYPGQTPFFAAGPNILVEVARVNDVGSSPVLSASLVVQPRLLSSESLMPAEVLPPFRILGLTTPFTASQLRELLVSRGARGYTLSSHLGQWEALIGPLAFVFFPAPGEDGSPDHADLGMIRFFYQAADHPAADPRIASPG